MLTKSHIQNLLDLARWWNTVFPFLSTAFLSALLSMRTFTTSAEPHEAAKSNGVTPSLSFALISAPLSIKYWITFTLSTGLSLNENYIFIYDSRSTQLHSPAIKRGVSPSCPLAFTLAPFSKSNRATSNEPEENQVWHVFESRRI